MTDVLAIGRHPLALILTALQLEYDAVRCHLSALTEHTDSSTGMVYEVGRFENWYVAMILTGMHQHAAGGRARDGHRLLAPKLAGFVGVAGALKDDANVGDVVVADSAYLYEAGKETEHDFRPRAQGALPNPKLLARARAEAGKVDWRRRVIGAETIEARVHVAKVVSGASVLADPTGPKLGLIKRDYSDAIAVEMEGHAFLESCSQVSCPAILVRGISDRIEDKGARDIEGWQPKAAARAAAFLFEVLAKFDPDLLAETA